MIRVMLPAHLRTLAQADRVVELEVEGAATQCAVLEALEATACPGPGACGGQFTANTMAMAGEFLGISPIQITGVPAMSPDKAEASREAGRVQVSDLLPKVIL